MPYLQTYITRLGAGSRKVYAVEYFEDRSNQEQVIQFIENYGHSKAHPRKAGGAYELIGVNTTLSAFWTRDTILWIHPGSMVYIYTDDRNVSFMGRNLFDSYFKLFSPYDGPIYRRVSDTTGRNVRALRLLPDGEDNLQKVLDFLSPYGSAYTSTVLYNGELRFYNDPSKIHVFSTAPGEKIQLAIKTGVWITITDPAPGETLPTLTLYAHDTFRSSFAKYDPTIRTADLEKESVTVQATPAIPSEYDQNISSVYDALAILRKDPREQDFEFAAKEIMDLLATAYNEGYDFGIDVAQTNPYTNWAK